MNELIYQWGWTPASEDGMFVGCYRKIDRFLKATWKDDSELWHVEQIDFKQLPESCHVWWMLTEKGRIRKIDQS